MVTNNYYYFTNTTPNYTLQPISSETPLLQETFKDFIMKISGISSFFKPLVLATAIAMSTTALISPSYGQTATPANAATVSTSVTWGQTRFAQQYVQVNGTRLNVFTAGQGDAVVLLHGYPQNSHVWRHVAPELAKKYRVIVPDLRGFGASEIAKDGYTMSNVAEDIRQLVQKLGHSKVKIVGHDWGAAVGYTYAARYRDEVTQLAFMESALVGAGFETLWSFSNPNPGFTFLPFLLMGDITEELTKGKEEAYMRHLWNSFTGDKTVHPFSDWQPYVEAAKQPGAITSGAQYYRAAYESAKQVQELNKVKLSIPVLAISGEKSMNTYQEQFARNFASNVKRTIVLTGAGHFVAEERPAEVTQALLTFLAE
jgi:pimeloyl-ACP methyl ester carboxylesterase